MSRIMQVIDPASGTGQGFLVNDSLIETIESLEDKARAGVGLSGAELRALLADLEGQAGVLEKTGPVVDREEIVTSGEGVQLAVAASSESVADPELQARISELEAQVATLTEEKSTLEALLEGDGDGKSDVTPPTVDDGKSKT